MAARGRTTRIGVRPANTSNIGTDLKMVADRPPVMRPGGADHEQHPNRLGDELRYRDGRRAVVADNDENGADHA